MNAEILSVGTELLLGGTVNTDARDISLALAELGVNVYWHTVVGDNPARLTECLYRARNRKYPQRPSSRRSSSVGSRMRLSSLQKLFPGLYSSFAKV
mgnify:CR=1 FL=1